MGILLDTTVVVEYERGRLLLPEGEPLAISAITASELLRGLHRADDTHRARREAFLEGIFGAMDVVPFDLRVARIHARLWAEMEVAGTLPGPHDLLIAATAISLGWPVATLNRRHFENIPGLTLRDLTQRSEERRADNAH